MNKEGYIPLETNMLEQTAAAVREIRKSVLRKFNREHRRAVRSTCHLDRWGNPNVRYRIRNRALARAEAVLDRRGVQIHDALHVAACFRNLHREKIGRFSEDYLEVEELFYRVMNLREDRRIYG